MKEKLGNEYQVTKYFKSAPAVRVGGFKSIQDAEKAMVEHYKNNSKRGNFYYRVQEVELERIDGIVYCSLILGGNQYSRKYTKEELN